MFLENHVQQKNNSQNIYVSTTAIAHSPKLYYLTPTLNDICELQVEKEVARNLQCKQVHPV